jgi:hypothetical protein
MSTQYCLSGKSRGQPPKFDPLFEIGRKKEVLENLQPRIRRYFSDSSSEVTSISISFPPKQPTMNSSCGFVGISGSSSSGPSTFSLIESMYSHYNPVVSTTNPAKVIKQYDLLKFVEDTNATSWYLSSPLGLDPATTLLPKFKDHLPNFSGNGTISINEHLIAFSNAWHNIGANENDTCMRLFVNYLEGKTAIDFFELLPNIFSTWDELSYWFRSTY